MADSIAWQPDTKRAAASRTTEFMERHGIDDYQKLLARSIAEPDWFWQSVVEFLGIEFDPPYETVLDTSAGIEWATWFNGGGINLSAVCVDRWAHQTPSATAIRAEREGGNHRTLTFAQLLDEVSRLAGGLKAVGVEMGDAVAVYLPMSAEAVISLLAIARIGATFIPIFSGYGPEAVATRLDEPRPKALICADGFERRGRLVEMKEMADSALDRAGGGISKVVVCRYAGRDDTPMLPGRDVSWEEVVSAQPEPARMVDSEHPVIIAYTSGTTGRPKGAIHVHGGLTVKVAQEGAFQTDIHPGDALMWATDMGWIMGPWMVIAGLANGAAVVTYDGAPDHPGPDRLWEIVDKHDITHLGVSPTLIRALQPHGADLARRHDLSSLRVLGSTGEPWNPDPWWWLFRQVGGERVPIVNLSGGTEIGACILSVNLLQGIKPTSLGGPSLGMAAEVLDTNGKPVRGEVGELAVLAPWPGMTRGFWKEPERYLGTYWDRFDGVWVHGDWASIDEDGFWYLHGRSDDTLNIAGKRVGPAEIESAVVALDEIVMAAAVGVPDTVKGETVAVFAVAAPGARRVGLEAAVTEAVIGTLGKAFRPSAVRIVEDLPRTRSDKIMRRVVRAVALGEDVGDTSTLENPDSIGGIRPL